MTVAINGTTGSITLTMPPGMVMYFANQTAPGGWLECNGAAISRLGYPDLFAAIGTLYGTGDGFSTFNLPDLRGQFLRCWDNGAGVDPARGVGTSQLDELKSHSHTIIDVSSSGSFQTANIAGATITWSSRQTSATGGTETRPKNVAMMACIKY